VLCTNPAALRCGPGRLTPVFPSTPFAPGAIGAATRLVGGELLHPATPGSRQPDAYTARCADAGGA
jgi:hypothetical protein